MKYGKDRKQTIILWSIFICYLLFNIILLIKHEPWRDEANVWLMAKNLSPIGLLREIKYQGHPCLWYFLVMPIAKMGFPFRSIEVLSMIIMASATWIFLWKAPFYWWAKVFVVFSPIFTYFNSCIARNYCLIILFMMIVAWIYPKRNEKVTTYGILLGLLVQADTIAIPIAGILSAGWLLESLYRRCCKKQKTAVKIWYQGLLFPLGSVIFWMLQMQGISGSNAYNGPMLGFRDTLHEIRNFMYVILIRLTGWNQQFCQLFFVATCLLMIFLLVLKKSVLPTAMLLGTFMFMAAFSACIYQLHIWHFLVLGSVMIAFFWITEKQDVTLKNRTNYGMVLCKLLSYCILLVFCGGLFWHWTTEEEPSSLPKAWNGMYSDAENAADCIRENADAEALIVDTDIAFASTVLSYLPEYTFYFAGTGKAESYADWTPEQSGNISSAELIAWVKDNFPERETFYLIETTESCLTDTENLEDAIILYETSYETVRDENYRIYQISLRP